MKKRMNWQKNQLNINNISVLRNSQRLTKYRSVSDIKLPVSHSDCLPAVASTQNTAESLRVPVTVKLQASESVRQKGAHVCGRDSEETAFMRFRSL